MCEKNNYEFRDLLDCMHKICSNVPDEIFKHFDSNKYLFSLYFEAFNSIRGTCILLEDGVLVPQACAILRMAIERTATIRVLSQHKELMSEYTEHQRFRFEIWDKKTKEKQKLAKQHFGEKYGTKDFIEYGWLKTISETYGLDKLIELANFQEDDAFKNWKNVLNQWVHGSVCMTNILSSNESFSRYINELIMISAKLLDNLICDFYEETQFTFSFNDANNYEKFKEKYRKAVLILENL